MSGHSKWTQIKRKKGAADVKRGALFSKLAKQLTVAARQEKNLDMVVAAARAANMPKDNIERAIKKGTGELGDGAQIEDVLYEAYGPGGAAILIETLTDNRNRTVNELRAVLNKWGGSLGQSGAVQFLFDRRGVVEVAAGTDPEATQLGLIEAGVEDVALEEDRVVGYVAPAKLGAVSRAVEASTLTALDTRLAWLPKALYPVDEVAETKLLKLLEAIDELEDVSSVETNAEL
ncbi:YebC/PmpR family DNA-binding transcriptional regulator [Candidatus Berkelbacteria bacterium]|nr:YebC/PmpR family DNA-binding transcriptional regulator [Candidatus Berkelbacteria bacterium]